jgi:glycosyltransferase involved in cell wall biosynthesis
LHGSAEEALRQAALFVPNYLDFAYQLAAISRARGMASWCIGICHCDQEHYYRLLRHYEPIIHSFIAVSRRCAERLLRYFPERAGDIHFVPYGVSLPVWEPPALRGGPLRLLYAGRLTNRQKRVLDLIDVVRELEARRVDYALDIVGVGPDREPLVAAFAGAPRVRVLAGVSHPEMARLYRDYDVYLLPSETEGTSIALLESMAHGLVPVATRVSGSEDAIADGRNGFLCEVADGRTMVERIAALADNACLRAELARRAHETVARRYRIEVQLEAFAECVRQTMTKPLIPAERALAVLGAAERDEEAAGPRPAGGPGDTGTAPA